MKKSYNEMVVSFMSMELSSTVLTGSLAAPVSVGTVTVKEYENGFESDFQDLHFD